MPHTLTVLFRRDPSRDRQKEQIRYRGYRPFWPDGRAVDVALDAFCQHGQRLLGLNRHLANKEECLIQLTNFPLADMDCDIHRLPGHRVRRLYIERNGPIGRVHFMDGTPTDIIFDLENDEDDVLDWIRLPYISDGDRLWFDLAAGLAEEETGVRSHRIPQHADTPTLVHAIS